MNSINKTKIVLIGSGNVATHLGISLVAAGFDVAQVWSRSMKNSSTLAAKIHSQATCDLKDLAKDADFYIFSVRDDALPAIIADVCQRCKKGVFIHTAGSVSMRLFAPYVDRYGVLYPMQTFTKERPLDFSKIPCFLEASDTFTLTSIKDLATTISNNVHFLNESERAILHLAAVFACNFSNCCFALSDVVLRKQGLDFDIMLPLVEEMVSKLHTLKPKDAQTGPASRGDRKIIAEHMERLSSSPDLQNVYKLMSTTIAMIQQNRINL